MKNFLRPLVVALALMFATPLTAQTPALDKLAWTTVISTNEMIAEYAFNEVQEEPEYLLVPVRVLTWEDTSVAFFFVQIDLRKETFGNARRIGVVVFDLERNVKYQDREATGWQPLKEDSPVFIIFENFLKRKLAGE